jgi:hypothetical protein
MFDVAAGVRRSFVAGGVMAGLLASASLALADSARKAADEREMLERARSEAPIPLKRLEGTISTAGPDNRTTVNIGQPSPVDAAALEARRRAELDRLSDKLRRASQARLAQPAPVDTPWRTEVTIAQTEPLAPNTRSALGKPMPAVPATGAANSSRVTVLMIMKPGNRGIRRFEKTSDPLLCTAEGCWISNGGDLPARFLSTARSLSIANTFGDRAGACRRQTHCTFRSVDLGAAPSFVRPIDLRVINHDRREIKHVTADESCRIRGDRLICLNAVRADDYTLWIVPEAVAAEAGTALLQRALDGGLSTN